MNERREHFRLTTDHAGRALLCGIASLLLLADTLQARTWRAAKSGQALEGEFISFDSGRVTIRNAAGKIFKVKLSQLSSADQKFITRQLAKGPGSSVARPVPLVASRPSHPAVASLKPLVSPLSVTSTPMTGAGNERKVILKITNSGRKPAKGMVLQMQYLRADGSLSDTVPHSQEGFYGMDDSVLKKGQVYEHKVGAFFMDDDTTAVDAILHGITYADGTSWPTVPGHPAKKGSDPVSGIVIGVLGQERKCEPVAACFNFSSKTVKGVMYKITYQDAAGKMLSKTSYGYSSDKSVMDAGGGVAVVGGDAPPKDCVSATLDITSVEFTDGSKWAPGG